MPSKKHGEACRACFHQRNRFVAEFYKRFGINKMVTEYPRGHYEVTQRMVDDLFDHINEEHGNACEHGLGDHIKPDEIFLKAKNSERIYL